MAIPSTQTKEHDMTKRTPRIQRKRTTPKAPTATRAVKTKGTNKPDGQPRSPRPHSKQATLIDLLTRPQGASLDQLVDAMGWQRHSVRAALALMKPNFGIEIASEKIDGVRTYRLASQEVVS
jgi:hypothetical protein